MRVVLSEKKNLAVNEELLNVLGDKDYNREFPYTAKVRIKFIYFKMVFECLLQKGVQ